MTHDALVRVKEKDFHDCYSRDRNRFPVLTLQLF
jgi:hypothetical protein